MQTQSLHLLSKCAAGDKNLYWIMHYNASVEGRKTIDIRNKDKLPRNIREIRKETFYCCSELKEIEIPKEIEKIGHRAFCGCAGLDKLVIPERVEIIDTWAFHKVPNVIFHGKARTDDRWGAILLNGFGK